MGFPEKLAALGERCCGCGACAAVCGKGAVSMVPDEWGFERPMVDAELCVGCVACERACVALGERPSDEALAVCWAKALDDELRVRSSSGGVFGLLGRDVLASDGVVCGAAWGSGCETLRHVLVEGEAGLDSVMRSKYLQSSVGLDVYEGVRDALRGGRRVLFAGTACQVAAMRAYLGALAESDQFLAVDVICHGVPSPRLWRDWLGFCSLREQGEVHEVNFRSKTTGWLSFSVAYKYATEKDGASRVSSGRFADDWYMKAFLSNASLRGSCFSCPSKRSCGSDLTIGDFWGFQIIHPEIDCSTGVSAVICNSEKGAAAFEAIRPLLDCGESTLDEVLPGNPSLVRSVVPYKSREAFLNDVSTGDIGAMLKKWSFRPTAAQRIRGKISACKRLLRKVLT